MSAGPASWRDGTGPIRVAMMLDMVGWALVLGRPGEWFLTNHGYDLMAQWASEAHWVLLFWLAAFSMAACAVVKNRAVRAALVACTCLLQAAIAVSFGAAPNVGTGFLTHVGIALLGSWLVWRELSLS